LRVVQQQKGFIRLNRKLLQFALEKQASLDSLTKTLNRVSFAERAGVETAPSVGRATAAISG
jgi:GGDEF domain-containing protein